MEEPEQRWNRCWTRTAMEQTMLSDQGNHHSSLKTVDLPKSKLSRTKNQRFDDLVLASESEMTTVEDDILDQLTFGGRFNLDDLQLTETADLFSAAAAAAEFLASPDDVDDDVHLWGEVKPPEDPETLSTNGDLFHTQKTTNLDTSRNDITTSLSSRRNPPLPPFHNFRHPPPPVSDLHNVVPSTLSSTSNATTSIDGTRNLVDVVDVKSSLSKTTRDPNAPKTPFTAVFGCSSAPSISPFGSKGRTGSRLFSRDRRRATYDNSAVPESWVSPQSALLTVLTRDLYPPASELVLPTPHGVVDLENYYAAFLPKNLSDDYAKGGNSIIDDAGRVSSIPSLLGRSASTESLHKDRLLPLLDDFFDCGDLQFSTKNIFRYSNATDDSGCGRTSRRSNRSSEIDNDDNQDDVGFYLDSNSPMEIRSLSRERMATEAVSGGRWVPYFGDPKGFSPPPSLVTISSATSALASPARRPQHFSRSSNMKESVKRSRSADPTVSERRNEKAKKFLRVRFADSEGKDLAKAKNFRKTDDLKIPTRALEPLRVGIERGLPAVGVRHFLPKNFHLDARSKKEEEQLVKEKKVLLRDVQITQDLIIGSVVVGNVSADHKKAVFVRCTYNDWNSFADIPAGQHAGDPTATSSSFGFALNIPRNFVKGDVLEFAVGYTGMGRIYWDNNDGKNYVIECFARQCPLHSEDRSWISFI